MRQLSTFAALALALPLVFGMTGCGEKTPPPPASQPEGEHPEHDHGQHDPQTSSDPAITEALAKLSPEDRALAEKQKVCPVSDEPLGSMGAPMKVEVLGRQVFICCKSCKADLLAKPEEFLAKLNK